MAYLAPHPPFAAGAALPVRLAPLVSSLLAGGHPLYFGGRGCPCVNEETLHTWADDALAGRLMDVPLLVHGTGLFSSDDPGHTYPVGFLSSK